MHPLERVNVKDLKGVGVMYQGVKNLALTEDTLPWTTGQCPHNVKNCLLSLNGYQKEYKQVCQKHLYLFRGHQ